jgi:hypothetical protein
LLWITRPRSWNGAPVWLGTFGLLFLAFKAGFVRHDAHVALSAAVLGALLVGQLGPHWPQLSAVLRTLIVVSWVFLWLNPLWRHGELLSGRYAAATGAVRGLVQLVRAPSSYAERFDQSLGEIRERFPLSFLPPANATADFIQHDQSILLAHGVHYTPRPVFQSYVVGTPALARKNLAFYTSASAPDYVLMTAHSIDGRLRSLEDALLWPVLLESYQARVLEDGGKMLWLERLETPPSPPAFEELGWKKRVGFAEVVALPDHDGPLWAKLKLDRTWLGRAMGFLFRHPVVRIHLLLHPDPARIHYFDEEFYRQKHDRRIERKILGFWRRYNTAEKHYSIRGKMRGFTPNPDVRVERLVPGVTGLGFLISPYVEDAEDFFDLHQRDPEFLSQNSVHAIEIQLMPGWGWASSLLFEDPVLELFTLASESRTADRGR